MDEIKANHSWHLANADLVAASAKYTFYKPSRKIIAKLAPGDSCRLIFTFESDNPEHPGSERMWVLIDEIDEGKFWGRLTNSPVYIQDLHAGDMVEFGPEHIIDLDVDDEESGIVEQYRDLCLATRRIIYEKKLIGYLYREEPQAGAIAGHTDSGWRLMEGDEEQAYVDDPQNLQFVSLGSILNVDDSFVGLLMEPTGSAFVRDAETGQFEQLD